MAMHTAIGSEKEKQDSPEVSEGIPTLVVNRLTDGLLDPKRPMLGPVTDGGRIIANTAPGCWGPMITPALLGGHEVTQPVAVEGAEIGDAIAIRIEEISVESRATASGNDQPIKGRFHGDPYVAGYCPDCKKTNPETVVKGIGPTSIRCAVCGGDVTPFVIRHGYTVAFDESRSLGVTLDRSESERIAHDAANYAALPKSSAQHSILTFAPHDLVGVAVRTRAFLGQLGTVPAVCMPDSHNAGDFGCFLIDAPHEFALTAAELEQRTDGHMDIAAVRAGATILCPVKVAGGGVYLGDMHALQGDGEIAGHTCDVAGIVKLRVQVIKHISIDGPILLPLVEDLPYLALPLSEQEQERALALAKSYGLQTIEESAPISVIGTGGNLNVATEIGLQRAAALLDMSIPEVKNRATITGAIELGRHPGVVRVTFRAPLEKLERAGLLPLVCECYGIKPS